MLPYGWHDVLWEGKVARNCAQGSPGGLILGVFGKGVFEALWGGGGGGSKNGA